MAEVKVYRSKYYTVEQIDQRLLQGYYDDAVSEGYEGTKEEFLSNLVSLMSNHGDIVKELVARIQGKSESSDASADPFKRYDEEFDKPNDGKFLEALNKMHSYDDKDGWEGNWRLYIGLLGVEVKNIAKDYPKDEWLQVIKGPYGFDGTNFVLGNTLKYHILYRTHHEDTGWSEFKEYNEDLETEVEKFKAIFGLNKYAEGYIKTGDVGTIVTDFSTSVPDYWRSCIVSAKPNDVFYIQGKGGNNSRLWAFLDENNTVIKCSAASIISDGENVVAPDGAVLLVANFEVSVAYKLMFIPESVSEVDSRLHIVESGLADLSATVNSPIIEPTGVGYLNTNVGVGNVVDLKPASSNVDWNYYVLRIDGYDVFEMANCNGGNNSRLWAFIDANHKLLSISDAGATVNNTAITITIPQNAAFLIINNNIHNKPNPVFKLYKNGSIAQRVEILESSVSALVNGYGKVKNILVLGNSYSYRSVAQGPGNMLNLAASIGAPMFVEVIGDGGASFEDNYAKYANDGVFGYRWEGDTQSGIVDRANEGLTFKEALSLKEWDFIILHQVSKFSGDIETFSPYLQNLIDAAKTYCKNENVKIGLMQTWAYANVNDSIYPTTNTTKPVFEDQEQMYKTVCQTYKDAIKEFEDVSLLIPCGTALQNARLTELGQKYNDFGASSTDGSHTNSVGTLITSLCVFNKVFAAESNIKLSEINNYCNLLSDDEFEIAKECVRNAIKFPFENKSIVL